VVVVVVVVTTTTLIEAAGFYETSVSFLLKKVTAHTSVQGSGFTLQRLVFITQ
jgi:hypothetical protein